MVEKIVGAVVPAKSLYDASQALSWVATRIVNTERRFERQSQIPQLINSLSFLTEISNCPFL